MPKDVLITPGEALIQFSSSAGTGSGQILADDDNNLVISNLVGDVLLGDGASDVFIGDGTNNVDIVFEQNGEIRDDGSGKNIIFGSKTTNVFVSGSNTVALQSEGGNVGIGKSTATKTLEVVGDISASGTLHVDGNISTSGSFKFPTPSEANTGNGIVFFDTSSNAPNTKVNALHWDFSNDDAFIYAVQSASDTTYLVNELRDNVVTDKFVWWFNNFAGATTDSFPLMLEGNKAVVNYIRDKNAVFHRDSEATNGAANNVDFYLLKSGSTSVSSGNSLIFGDVSAAEVTINGNMSASGFISASSFSGDGAGLSNVSATATPAGSDTEVQFNDGGSLGGDAGLVFNKTTNDLTLTGTGSAGYLTATEISSSEKIITKELLVKAVANSVTPFVIRNVDGEKQLDLVIDTNQHSELGIFKDGTEKVKFNSYWPTVIDNDFYETGGGIVLGSDTTQAANRYGIFVSAGPDSGSAYFDENVKIGGGQETAPTERLEIHSGGRIKVTPGTDLTGSILSLANDHDVLFSSQNDSATGDPQQFVIQHNDGGTDIINRRGDLILSASGDIGIGAPGKDITLTDGDGTAEFIFNLEDAPELDVDGDFTIDGSGLIKLDSATTNIDLVGNVTASGNFLGGGFVSGSEIISQTHITASGNISSSLTASFGKVTIGTSVPANHSNQLTVEGGAGGNAIAHFERTIGGTGTIKISSNASEPQILFKADNDDERMNIGVERAGGAFVIASGSSIADKEIVVVTQDNKVGINTTAPTKALQVEGDISASGAINTLSHITSSGNISQSEAGNILSNGTVSSIGPLYQAQVNNGTTAGPRFTLGGLADADSFMSIEASGGINKIDTKARDFHIFSTAATTGFYFDEDNANIGIQTTSPVHPLQVEGNITASGVIKGDGGISGSNGTFTGTIIAEHLETTDDLTVADDINLGDQSLISYGGAGRGKISGSALNLIVANSDLVIQTGSSNTAFRVDSSAKGNIGIEGSADLLIKNHITSSVDSKFQWGVVGGNRVQIQDGNITASGGTKFGTTGQKQGSHHFQGIAGDTNFFIIFDKDGEEVMKGSGDVAGGDLTYEFGDTAVAGNGNVFKVDEGNNIFSLRNDSNNTNVGINTTNPTKPLQVTGEISASGGIHGGTTTATTGQATGSYDFPGAIMGYNVQGLNVGHSSVNLTTSLAVIDSSLNICFVAPKSGIVEIEVQFYYDLGFSSGTALTIGLSDNATYNAVESYYEQLVGDPDENDDLGITHKWVVNGLTPGTTYKYWFGGKVLSTSGTPKIAWGGNASGRFKDFIMKATALPSNTEIET